MAAHPMNADLLKRWKTLLASDIPTARDCHRDGDKFSPVGLLLQAIDPDGWGVIDLFHQRFGRDYWAWHGHYLYFPDALLTPLGWTRATVRAVYRLADARTNAEVGRDLGELFRGTDVPFVYHPPAAPEGKRKATPKPLALGRPPKKPRGT